MSWKRKGEEKPVELVFKFKKPRQFKKVHVFTANLLHLNTQVFSKAVIWFSIGGKYFTRQPITYQYMADTILQEPRNVSIRLNRQVGQYVKIQLFFANIWMSVSEVTFDSQPVNGVYEPELPPSSPLPPESNEEPETSTAQTLQGNEVNRCSLMTSWPRSITLCFQTRRRR